METKASGSRQTAFNKNQLRSQYYLNLYKGKTVEI